MSFAKREMLEWKSSVLVQDEQFQAFIFTLCIVDGVHGAALGFVLVPKGENDIGVIDHILVALLHTNASVVVRKNRDLVGAFKDALIPSLVLVRPTCLLTLARNSNLQSDMVIHVVTEIKYGFRKVRVCADSTPGDKMNNTVFVDSLADIASHSLQILLMGCALGIGIVPRKAFGTMPSNAASKFFIIHRNHLAYRVIIA